jgi:hypothetical protein
MAYQKTAMQTLEASNDVTAFARKYSAYISDSRQYRRRVPEPVRWDDPRAMYEHYYLTTYDEPYVEMHLPRGSLEHIMSVVDAHGADADKVNHAMGVLNQHRADERVRDDNPAVQKAWMKYITLLELARK